MISENRIRQIIKESIKSVLLEMSPNLLSQEEVIRHFNNKHGEGRYDYSKVKYVNDRTPVTIGCTRHNPTYWFEQPPHRHKRGEGCPLCQESKMEKAVRKYLDDNKITGVTSQFKLGNTRLKLDFYIQQINRNGQNIKLGIECQGKQHFYPVEAFGGEPSFVKQQARDAQKASICKMKILHWNIYFTMRM